MKDWFVSNIQQQKYVHDLAHLPIPDPILNIHKDWRAASPLFGERFCQRIRGTKVSFRPPKRKSRTQRHTQPPPYDGLIRVKCQGYKQYTQRHLTRNFCAAVMTKYQWRHHE